MGAAVSTYMPRAVRRIKTTKQLLVRAGAQKEPSKSTATQPHVNGESPKRPSAEAWQVDDVEEGSEEEILEQPEIQDETGVDEEIELVEIPEPVLEDDGFE